MQKVFIFLGMQKKWASKRYQSFQHGEFLPGVFVVVLILHAFFLLREQSHFLPKKSFMHKPLFEFQQILLKPAPVLKADASKRLKNSTRKTVVAEKMPSRVESVQKTEQPEEQPRILENENPVSEKIVEETQTDLTKVGSMAVAESSGKISSDSLEKIKQHYLFGLRTALEQHKRYPRLAKRLKQQGSVRVQFSILKNGSIQSVKISRQSKFKALDQGALQTVLALNRYRPIPDILGMKQWHVEIPISYQLY